jgi:aminoglycoside phosphotransferase (APT) family kinase protein
MAVSRIFKELSRVEIERVVAKLYGGSAAIRECRLMKGGLFNTTYHIRTAADDQGVVLRVAPVNPQLLFDFEKRMMSAEPMFFKLLQARDIPTSEVVLYDDSSTVIEREYIVFRYIRSIPMNDPGVPEAARPGLYQEIGEMVAAMHQISSEAFGWQRPDDGLARYATWSAFLRRFAGEIAERAADQGVFEEGELKRFLAVFQEGAVFDQITQPRMVHADLWEGNILVRENEGHWSVAAIIDLDRAVFGDKEMEFAYPEMINSDFLRGYGAGLDRSPEAVFRRKAYQLLGRFFYAVVWQMQYGDAARSEAAKRRGLALLGQC